MPYSYKVSYCEFKPQNVFLFTFLGYFTAVTLEEKNMCIPSSATFEKCTKVFIYVQEIVICYTYNLILYGSTDLLFFYTELSVELLM